MMFLIENYDEYFERLFHHFINNNTTIKLAEYFMKEMNDALVILPDDNNDGKADRIIEFAKVHNPLGFEFWGGGVVVTSGPDLIFLKDTDGDDVADLRYPLLQQALPRSSQVSTYSMQHRHHRMQQGVQRLLRRLSHL